MYSLCCPCQLSWERELLLCAAHAVLRGVTPVAQGSEGPEKAWAERAAHLNMIIFKRHFRPLNHQRGLQIACVVRSFRNAEDKVKMCVWSTISGLLDGLSSALSQALVPSRASERSPMRISTTSVQTCRAMLRLLRSMVDAFRRQITLPRVAEIVAGLNSLVVQKIIAGMQEQPRAFRPALTLLAEVVHIWSDIVNEPSRAFQKSLPTLCRAALAAEAALPLAEGSGECSVHFCEACPFSALVSSGEKASDASFFKSAMGDTLACLSNSDATPRDMKFAMTTLSQLQEKHRLFSSSIFQQEMAPAFTTAFFNILVEGSRELLREQILSLLHGIASCDFGAFFDFIVNLCRTQLVVPGVNEDDMRRICQNYLTGCRCY